MDTMKTELTNEEQVFAERMLPHVMVGKMAEDAARAVIEDDARIFEAFCDRRYSYFVAIGDGHSTTTREGVGDVIAREITATVYERLRSSA